MTEKRKRSPSFPYISMRDAESYLRMLYNLQGRNPVPMTLAMNSMDLTPTSSTSNRIVSTMIDYGVLGVSGSGDDKTVWITPIGEQILQEKRTDELLQKRRIVTLGDDMMKKAFNEWKSMLPSDEAIISTLRFEQEKFGFTDRAAKRFVKVIRENYNYAKLDTFNYLLDIEGDSAKPSNAVNENLDEEKNLKNNQQQGDKTENKPTSQDTKLVHKYITMVGSGKTIEVRVSEKLTQKELDFIPLWLQLTDIIEKGPADDDIPF